MPLPIGHQPGAAALVWPVFAERRHRAAAISATATLALIVGATRAYLGVQWPSDVLGGWSLGCLLLTLSVAGLSLLRLHSFPTPQYGRGHDRPPSKRPRQPSDAV